MPLTQENAATAVKYLAQVAHAVIGPAVGAGASLFDDTGWARSTGATDALTATADAPAVRARRRHLPQLLRHHSSGAHR